MKKTILAAIFILPVFTGLAQKTELTPGPDLGVPTDMGSMYMVEISATALYGIFDPREEGKDNRLEKYNASTLQLEFKKNIHPEKIEGLPSTYEGMDATPKYVCLFYSTYNESGKKHSIYMQKCDLKTGAEIGTPLLVYSTTLEKESDQGRFRHIYYEDRKKSLFLYESGKKLYIEWNDAEGNMILNDNIVFPYEEDKFEKEDMSTDENGNIYWLIKVERELKGGKKNKHAKQYDLISYDVKSKTIVKTELDLSNDFLTVPFMEINKDMLWIGGYCCSASSEDLAGSLLTRVSKKSGAVFSSSYKEFNEKILNQPKLDNGSFVNRLQDFRFRGCYKRSDGGVHFAAEQVLLGQGAFMEEIIVTGADSLGTISFVSLVPKHVYGLYDLAATTVTASEDKIYFIYNDTRKGLVPDSVKLKKKDENRLTKEAIVIIASVDKSGNVEKKELFSPEDRFLFYPVMSATISEREVVLFGTVLGNSTYNYHFTRLKFR